MTHLQHQAPAPNLAAIPAELIARVQWVNWRYELDKNGKPTKVPYTPGTTRKASHSRPSSWRSFAKAVASYQARPDFFAGIGYVFAKDDPYVGGDIDHSLDLERVPATYAEISPSGNGIKFIARASGDYGRKTARGELYSSKRFFTITGNVLPGHEAISDCQAAVEAFAASLGNRCTQSSGRAGAGNRAQQAADIPEATWEEARTLNRTSRESLIRRVKAAGGRDTQLALVLAGDFAGFHRRWAFVGLYREDGSLDDSQVRAVAAFGIKGRGFTFPEYVVIMSALYAQQALKKWGTKERWREELAALWQKAPGPKFARRIKKVPRAARGRAGSHTQLLEQVYSFLQDARAGAQAIIHLADLVKALGVHKSTASSLLADLEQAGRIERRRLAGGGGLVISFKREFAYSAAPAAELPAPAQQNDDRPAIAEETHSNLCVSSDRAVPELSELAKHYNDQAPNAIGERLVSTKTGAITYRRSARHFAQLVTAEYPYTVEQAIAAYKADQELRKVIEADMWRRFFSDLRAMSDAELIAYIGGGCRRSLERLGCGDVGRLPADVDMTAIDKDTKRTYSFDKHLYQTRLKCARRQAEWRQLKLPAKATKVAQRAADDAQQVKQARQKPRQRLVACEPVRYAQPAPAPILYHASYVNEMYERLKARQTVAT